MKLEQIYTGCLAEAAYYIESEGEAAVIDPLRECEPYLERAAADGAKIKYVLETHFHADFVSGHLDLARKTGAEIVYGPGAQPAFPAHVAADGEILQVGKVQIKVLHTPGHTMESSCFLLIDEEGREQAIFTGDTLFIGDVGRPDLAVKSDLSREDLAGRLYDSLRDKIMPLADSIVIYPGHGAGSACGKKMSNETMATLGDQKRFNYALRESMTREEFVREVTAGLAPPPQYFPKNAVLNKSGYESIDLVLERGLQAMDVTQFRAALESGEVLVLDTRPGSEFVRGSIPGSLYIGLDGQFAAWVGTLVRDLATPIIFLAEPGREQEVVTRLARVGYDNAMGYLEGGTSAWLAAGNGLQTIRQVDAETFADMYILNDKLAILDVRRASEFAAEHVLDAESLPLETLEQNLDELERDKEYYLHCAGGYRSLIAASILKSHGFDAICDIAGGLDALRNTAIPRSEYVEPVSML